MNELQKTILEFNQKNYVAWHYPRKKLVRINGGKTMPENEALQYMKDILKK